MKTRIMANGAVVRRVGTMSALILAALAGLPGCEGATGPEGTANVSVAFGPDDTPDASTEARGLPAPSLAVTAEGTNGTLTLESVHLVMNEFELERSEGACPADGDAAGDEDDDCEEFEAGPRFVELPLQDGSATAVTQQVPAGTYVGLEFEVEDLEDDGDGDDGDRTGLLEQIRTEFSEWPEGASLRVSGRFAPDGGEERPFVAYFEAEIEVEKRFPSPLTVDDSGSRTVTVEVAPREWFTRPDGSVVDLSRYDWETTGEMAELEVELEDGFTETEFDD